MDDKPDKWAVLKDFLEREITAMRQVLRLMRQLEEGEAVSATDVQEAEGCPGSGDEAAVDEKPAPQDVADLTDKGIGHSEGSSRYLVADFKRCCLRRVNALVSEDYIAASRNDCRILWISSAGEFYQHLPDTSAFRWRKLEYSVDYSPNSSSGDYFNEFIEIDYFEKSITAVRGGGSYEQWEDCDANRSYRHRICHERGKIEIYTQVLAARGKEVWRCTAIV